LAHAAVNASGMPADHDFIGLRLGFGEAGENYEQDKAI
jgi:hypothetical protein